MYAAVDIGGTKTLVAVFDKDGKIVEQEKFPTPQDYTNFKIELAKVVEKLSTKRFISGCVASPGRIDREKGIGLVYGNLPWENVPLVKDIEAVFGCRFTIENDAKLAALSEARLAHQYRKVLYITVSTGIGGGLVIHGKISPDFQDNEIGSMLLEHGGKLQHWEEFASGKAIVGHFGKRASEIVDPQIWYIIARNLAVGLIDLIATLTPDVIIIGGGVGSHFDKFKDRLLEELAIYQTPLLTIPPIQIAAHPEEAVIYGCYQMAREDHADAS